MTTSSYPVSAETRISEWVARGESAPPLVDAPVTCERQDAEPEASASATEHPATMQPGGEYDRLQQQLIIYAFGAGVVISIGLAFVYPPNVVANYGLGALCGVVYLRMLARGVARLGLANRRLGPSRMALVAALVVVATQVDSLQVLPIFLGFLTYKAALLIHAVQVLTRLAKPKSS